MEHSSRHQEDTRRRKEDCIQEDIKKMVYKQPLKELTTAFGNQYCRQGNWFKTLT